MANTNRKNFSHVVPTSKQMQPEDYKLLHEAICSTLPGKPLNRPEPNFAIRFDDEDAKNEFELEYEVKNNGSGLLFSGFIMLADDSKKNKRALMIWGLICFLLSMIIWFFSFYYCFSYFSVGCRRLRGIPRKI